MKIDKDLVWNKESYFELINYLLSLGEDKYKAFNLKLIETKYEMIGIRIPILRKLAKDISKTSFRDLFSLCTYKYYEEVLIFGILISYVEDYEEFFELIKSYVFNVDNWAICDTVVNSLKIINKNKDKAISLVNYLIKDKYNFSKRFGFVILINFYVSEEYLDVIFGYVSKINVDDYYVNMAISWLLCECYVKYRDETYEYIKGASLNQFVLRKTISKVNDSFRVNSLDKVKLRSVLDYK